MADIQANIGIGVDTSQALAAIRQLQREISVFHTLMAKGGAAAAAKSMAMQQGLINTINETGKFSASMTRISSSTESFTNALEKNKLSMTQYFRYAGGASKTFGKMFTREFNTINKVATERVKDLQTQYISMGRDANGALQSIKVRPLALDMDNLGTRVQLAAQKQQIFNQLMKQGTTNLLNFGKNTQWAGRQLMVGFTIPLTIFGATAAREFQKLEEQAVKFRRVYGDMFTTDADTEKALANVRALAEEFTKYGIAVEKTIGLAAKVAQMGNVGTDLTEQVTQATRLAVLGGLEQEEALDTTISLTNAFGVAAEDLAGKIAFLNAAENQTILSIEDFNEAIPKAGSVVQQLGGDVEDLAFFLTAMREGGINASQGANALKTSLARLIAPTEVAKKEMAGFGIDIVGIVERNAGNLRQTVIELGQELDTLDPLNRARAIEQLFGKFQFARMSTMFQNIAKEGSQANKVLDLTKNSMEELAIVAERELRAVEESPAFKLQKQMEQLKAALAPIGEEFIKAVGPLIEFGTKLLQSFNNLGDGGKQFIVILTAVAGVVAPAALMAFGLIANGVANLLKFFQFLGNAFGMLSGKSTMLGGQTEYMTQQQIEAAAVAASLGQSHSNLTQIFTAEASAVASLVTQYRAAIAEQRKLSIGQTARGVAKRPPGFARGGIIRGPGTGTSDSIFAMLSDGEAVIPAAIVKENPEAVKQLISGNIPGYSEGNADELALGAARSATGDQNPKAAIVNIFREQIERRVDRLGESLEDAAKNVSSAFSGLSEQAKKTAEELRKSPQYSEHREEVFAGQTQQAHLGPSGKTVSSAQAAATSPGKAPLQAMAKLESVTGKTYNVEEKHSWVKSMGTISNQQMGVGVAEIPEMVEKGTTVGRSGDKLLKEFEAQSLDDRADSYAEGVAAAGGDISDPETRAELVAYDQRIQQLLAERLEENANLMILDTQEQIDALPEDMRGNYVSMQELEAKAAEDTLQGKRTGKVREVALEVPREHRISKGVRTQVSADAATALAEGKISQAEFDAIDKQVGQKKSPQFMVAEKDKKRIRESIDADSVDTSEAQKIGQNIVDSTAKAMNTSAEANSPAKRFLRIGENVIDSTAMGMEKAAAEQEGKPPLPGNLAAPKPPVQPEVAKPGRFGKLFSSAKDKINESRVAQKAADYLSGETGSRKISTTPGMSDAEKQAQRTAKAINQDLFDKGLITEDMQATPLGQTQGVTPVRVVDGQIDIGDNSIDTLANASPAANEAAERDELNRKAIQDNRAAQEEATEAVENLAESTDKKSKEDKAALKEQKRQNRQARAGKALAGLGTLTMAAGMATQVEGAVGETAQKLVGPLAILSGIAPLLMALPAPLALLAAAIGAGVWAFMSYNKMIDEARKKGYDLVTALGNGEEAMNTFAEFAGTASSSEILSRRVDNIGRIMEVQPGKSTFGQSFTGSDVGKEYVEQIKQSMLSLGENATIQLVQRQMSQAILDQILTLEQARSIVAAVGDEINDYGFAIDISSKLIELVGPNGEDLFKDPLLLTAKIVEEQTKVAEATARVIADSIETVTVDSQEAIDMYAEEAMAKRQDVINSGDFVGRGREELSTTYRIGQILAQAGVASGQLIDPKTMKPRTQISEDIEQALQETFGMGSAFFIEALTDPLGDTATQILEENLRKTAGEDPLTLPGRQIAAAKINAQNVGESIGMVENYFAALQGGMSSIIVGAQDNITAAIESGDSEAIAAALEARDLALAEYAAANAENTATIEQALLDVDQDTRKENFDFQREMATEGLAGAEKRQMETALGLVSGTEDEEYVRNVKLRGMVIDGDLAPNTLIDLIGGKEELEADLILDAVANLSVNIGKDYATKAAELVTGLSGIVDDAGNDLSEQIGDSFILGLNSAIEAGDLTEGVALDVIEGFGDLTKWQGVFPEDGLAQILSDFAGDPEKILGMQEVQSELSGIDFDDAEAVEGAIGGRAKEALDAYRAAESEAWDALSQKEQEEFATILSVTLDYDGATWLAPFLQSQQEGDDAPDVTLGKRIEQRLPSTTEVPPPGTEEPKLTPTGSGSEPQIDSLIKKLRDLRLATVDMKKGWEGMQEVLSSIFAGGTNQINVFEGLSNQIRRMGVGENLIEMIVGMDPDEYEKRKNELFVFDAAGNIVDTTDKLKNMNAAFNAVALGEYVNGQQSFIEKTKNQISAIRILTASGLALADAYEVVQDAATAAAIAQGASAEQIQELIRFTQIAKEEEEKLERERERSRIAESVLKTNEEFRNQVEILNQLSRASSKYSDEQVKAIMGDSDLQKLFLDPSIDPKALEAALKNAEEKANLEVQIAIAEGREDELFGQYLTEVNDYFSREEAVIGVNFEMDTADESKIIEDAQRQIAAIQYQLDDYNAELEQISWSEEDINEKYDKRVEALDEIADANQKIAEQQKAQLDIADALSKGDIAAAARATAELRSQQAADAQQTQKEQLDRAREAELAALTGPSGMTREQLEDAITELERQVFQLEETALEPAKERVRLAEITRDLAIEQLELNGMTRDEFDQIAASTNLAALNMEDMVKSAEKLVAMGEFIRTGTKPANWEELFPTPKAAPPPPAPAPQRSSAPAPAPAPATRTYTVKPGDSLSKIAQQQGVSNWQAIFSANRGQIKNPNLIYPGQTFVLPAAGGGYVGRYASGGVARKSRSGPPLQMAMGGKVKRYANGGMIIPKRMAEGGYSMGTDIVPAMLTPGEFVVRRPAVSAFGVENLEKINRGTYNDGSVYNYNLAVNVRSNSDPNRIARAVITQIKQIDNQRIRSNRI